MEKKEDAENSEGKPKIFDIKIAETSDELFIKREIGELENEIRMKIIHFIKKFSKNEYFDKFDKIKMQDLRDFIDKLEEGSTERKEANKEFRECMKKKEIVN